MGTTAEKLTYLNTTKAKIRTGLNDLGAGLTESDTFRSYANVLADIYDELPKITGESTDLELIPTKKGKLSITPKGSSSQFSTEGKNILNPKTTSTTKNGVTLTYDEISQEITLNGTCDTNNTTFNFTGQSNTIPANTTIYSRIKYISGSSTGKLNLQIFNSGYSRSAGVSTDSGLSADITNSTSYSSEVTFSVNRIRVDSGSSFNNLKFKVYLSTVDSEYELFTGKAPAPNPDYPFMPSRVTGENSIENCNVNLFDEIVYKANYSVGSDGTLSSNPNYNLYKYNINQNSNFTIKLKNTDTNSRTSRAVAFDKNDNFIETLNTITISGGTTSSYSFTTPNNTSYILFHLPKLNSEVMLVKGSTAPSEYVSHEEQNYQLSLGNIELNSSPDGTVRDEIRGTLDNWFKREYIGKVVLDGSEAWSMNTTQDGNYRYHKENFIDAKNDIGYCTHFKIGNIADRNVPGQINKFFVGSITQAPQTLQFVSDITTVASFKEFLQIEYNNQNPVTVWYAKAEYTDIPITDTTLISQLNDIYNNAHSYNGVTNITSTYEDGNEQMILDASALKSWSDITSTATTLSTNNLNTLQFDNQLNITDFDVEKILEEAEESEE